MTAQAPGRIRALRANALAAVVMLLVQYCLGISVNLYATIPPGDHGKSLFGAFGSAVGRGPVILTLHALLGTLLLITALTAVIRSARIRRPAPMVLTGLALVAILVAWLSGSDFVAHMRNGSSLSMALATAVAILCYTVTLVLTIPSAASRSPSPA